MASLFQGAPQTATSYTKSSTETPKWMQDAIYNQVQWATNVANTPYQAYNLPTVAELSPLQQQAYNQVQANQGAWKPTMQQATSGMAGLTTAPGGAAAAQPYFAQAAGTSIPGSAQPYLNQQSNALSGLDYGAATRALQPYVSSALSTSGATAAQPYIQSSAEQLAGIDTGTAARTLDPYVQSSLASGGLQAAAPYLQQASQSASAGIQDFMNPYTSAVTDRIAQLGARNLSENLLPAVSDAFVRAGQFGGTRMGEFGSRALRDTQESVLGQQSQALQAGYGQALTAAQQEAARMGQLASTAGGLGSAQQQAILQGGQALTSAQQQAAQQEMARAQQLGQLGQQFGQLTQAQQQAILQGGQALSGAEQQALAQRLQGAGQYGQMASTLGGLTQAQQQLYGNIGSQAGQLSGADLTRQQSALTNMAEMAKLGQALSTADVGALESAGLAQQGQMQKQLDAAQQQYQAEQLYPKQQLDWLSTQIRGMAPITPQSTTNTGTTQGATYAASPLSQLAQGLSLYKGLTSTN